MYRPVPRGQIADALAHLRGLFRELNPSNERDSRAQERREIVTRNLLSNLIRTNEHPTLHTVLEIADTFSLTLDGAHQLFGYDLGSVRNYDFHWNGGRTRIIESYPFERDLPVDLPSQLGDRNVFGLNATLRELVQEWQTDIPIRALESEGWRHPGAFYVQVGTEDSLGSSLPPGAIALVEPINDEERARPNPRAIYLLQFGNGYRCSRCVVTRTKLLLLVSVRNYTGPQEFAYPASVRIAGRIRMFALSLPVPDYPFLQTLPSSNQNAPLILPWEHRSMDKLFAAKHRRFQRSQQERLDIRKAMTDIFASDISSRTERRYRHPTSSQPHVSTLIHLTIANAARYTDSLRAQRALSSDRGRFSLETLLKARHLTDVLTQAGSAHLPMPKDRWEALRKDFVEWPVLLSMKFPHLRFLDDRVVRLPQGSNIQGLDPSISPGSLLLLDKILGTPNPQDDVKKAGWSRPMYALERSAEIVCGYLEKSASQYLLFTDIRRNAPTMTLHQDEVHQLSLITGIAVPV